MGQAKIRAAEIAALKAGSRTSTLDTWEVLQDKTGYNGDVRVRLLKMPSTDIGLEQYHKACGYVPAFVEHLDNHGKAFQSQALRQMFGQVKDDGLWDNFDWDDVVVEVTQPVDEKGTLETTYTGIRVATRGKQHAGLDGYRPAYDDTVRLSPVGAGLARCALAYNACSHYIAQTGKPLMMSFLGGFSGAVADKRYHLAMLAADVLDEYTVYLYLD